VHCFHSVHRPIPTTLDSARPWQPIRSSAHASPQGKAKYKAWQKEIDAGTTPEDAETRYIALVEKLKEKYGYDEGKAAEPVGGS